MLFRSEKFDAVLALPGVGRYIAGAICSIAFGQPTPILDGNVMRVFSRLFGIDENPREPKTNERLWAVAQTLVREAATLTPAPEPGAPNSGSARSPDDRFRAGSEIGAPMRGQKSRASSREPACSHLNQALMELGAVICTPRRPKCHLCPLRKHCVAFREDRTDQLPNLGRRIASTGRRFAAFVVERKGRFLVRRRPPGAVNALLWEFPNTEADRRHPKLQRLAENLFGSCPLLIQPLHQVRHTITRYRITLDVFRAEFAHGKLPSVQHGRWCSSARLRQLAFPSAHRKIARLLQS